MEILQVVTEYGIGWIVAAYFIKENKELHVTLQKLTEDAIKSKMAISERMNVLSDLIKTQVFPGS